MAQLEEFKGQLLTTVKEIQTEVSNGVKDLKAQIGDVKVITPFPHRRCLWRQKKGKIMSTEP